MTWFILGGLAAYIVMALMIVHEFEEYLLDINQPEPKSKPWRHL